MVCQSPEKKCGYKHVPPRWRSWKKLNMQIKIKTEESKMTEVKTQKNISSEEQTKTELTNAISYIAKKEANLSRYTDKMSQALEVIATKINDLKISRDIKLVDPEPFIINKKRNFEEKGYLEISDSKIHTKYYTLPEGVTDEVYMETETWAFWAIPRKERKAIITSGRMPKFLKYVSEKLEETEQEYKQAAEIAEKMAQAIQ